jgi:hypothetical protein
LSLEDNWRILKGSIADDQSAFPSVKHWKFNSKVGNLAGVAISEELKTSINKLLGLYDSEMTCWRSEIYQTSKKTLQK